MYESANVSDDADRTAFRRAEKKYKLYYEQDSKFSRKKKLPKPIDLSELLDFNLISQNFNNDGVLPDGIRVSKVDSSPVFCIDNRPGKLKSPTFNHLC
jgi:alkylated DNA repair protein alkB family protein 1